MDPRELTTQRTQLRPFLLADAEELLPVFRDAEVRRYLLDDVLVTTAWVEDEIASSQQRFAHFGTGLWAVRLPVRLPVRPADRPADRATIVGFVGFREFRDPPELQLIYGLLPECWGKGLATEVTARVCDYAFRQLGRERITATTDLPNRASARVLRHLGMELVGTSNDGGAGMAHFAIDRDHWCARSLEAES